MKLIVALFLFSSFSLYADDYCSVPDLSSFLPQVNLPAMPNEELIEITKINFKRNKAARFCTRPVDMVDTIVIHHSETPATNTATDMNSYHLNRVSYKTNDAGQFIRDSHGRKIPDPWYMVGYSYVVNAPYEGTTLPKPLVTEGRPLDIVGSHAGSAAFTKMDEDQKKMWADGKVQCGKEGGVFKVDPTQSSDGNIKANISSIGIVVVGNYSPKSSSNPNGYLAPTTNYPNRKHRMATAQTLDMLARLVCQLQKTNPRMKTIKWHNFYTNTSCPGNLKSQVDQMKALAKGYGCEFN